MNFKDKNILVTGATRGIGKEIASSFAKQGGNIIILGRNEEAAKKVIEELSREEGSAEYFLCDVTNKENTQEIINKILDKYKRVDILINNAGITKDNLILRMSTDDWDEVLNVNLSSVFYITKLLAKSMLKAKSGKIINISSIIGLTGNTGQANYAASKAGIIGLTKSIALEFATRGITCNSIAPGYIQTEMTAQLNKSSQDDLLKSIPMQKFGDAADVASACLFLASDAANYITGQTIVVDGGMTI